MLEGRDARERGREGRREGGRAGGRAASATTQRRQVCGVCLTVCMGPRSCAQVEEADVALLKKLRLAQDRFERVVVPHRKHFGEQPVNQLGHHRRSLAAVPASKAGGAAGSAGPARK